MSSRRRREIDTALRWLHRWVGLTLGVPFVIVCLSGSLLLFQPQFFHWAHGDLIPDDMPSSVGSIDRWVENASAAVPTLGDPIAVWPPGVEHNISDAGMLIFGGLEPGGLGNMGFAGVLVAPSTGEVLGVIDIDRSPAYAPLFLHRDLLAGELGQIVLGAVALVFLPMLLVGTYLWWPRKGRLRNKLSPRPWRQTLTRARPLHDWTGIWVLPILILLTGTGLYIVRPAWVEPLLRTIPDTSAARLTEQSGTEDAAACLAPIGFDTAIARAQDLVPAGRLAAVYPHEGSWELVFRTGASEARFRETHMLADLDCGTVAIEAAPESRAPRETTEMWLFSLHDGSAAGTAGRLVVAIAGLFPLVLLWSGIRMWLRGRRRLAAGLRTKAQPAI